MPNQIPAHNTRVQPRSPLVRILGLGFSVAVIFGGTVGVGILRLPGTIAGELRSFWLILAIWAAGALYALLGAISLSELGTAMPQAGGFYIYARRAFGPAVGFATGWADWLNNCAVGAYGAVTAAEYLGALFAPLAAWPKAVALGLLAPSCEERRTIERSRWWRFRIIDTSGSDESGVMRRSMSRGKRLEIELKPRDRWVRYPSSWLRIAHLG